MTSLSFLRTVTSSVSLIETSNIRRVLRFKHLLFIILFLFAIPAVAVTVETEFTYAEGTVGNYGARMKESLDVAVCLNDPSLAGMELVGFSAYINTLDGVANPALWLSSSLNLLGGKFTPDIASFPVEPFASDFRGWEAGEMHIDLEDPYVLTDRPLYIGYSFTLTEVVTTRQQYPIVAADNPTDNGFFLHGSLSLPSWTNMRDVLRASVAIVLYLRSERPEYGIDVVSIEPIYLKESQDFNADIILANHGMNPVGSFDYTISVDGAPLQNGSYAFTIPFEPEMSGYRTITLPFDAIEGKGLHTIDFKITDVDGNANESVVPGGVVEVTNMPYLPLHRPLVEEYTGLWCGACPRGYIAMEMIDEIYGENQTSICFHDNDAMSVTSVFPMFVSVVPSASIDRRELFDPYTGSGSDHFGISRDLEAAMEEISPASIDLSGTIEDESVTFTADVKFVRDFANSPYIIGYVLLANGLQNPNWGQYNFTGFDPSLRDTPLEPLIFWGGVKYGLVFNKVAIDVNGMNGVEGSLPVEIEAEKTYSHSYTFNFAGNKLFNGRKNLEGVAFIVDSRTGKVVNSAKHSFAYLGIDTTPADAEITATEYYNLAGVRVSNPSCGTFIRIDRLSDGTCRTTKITGTQMP